MKKLIKNIFFYFPRSMDRYDFSLVVILLVGFIARIVNLPYPIGIEVNRDYLIGHHILAYKEFILLGPSNLLSYPFNSPFFSYLIALFLMIKDDIFFLSLINIFLQILTIVFIYLIAKKLFSSGTALIASIFFTFSFVTLQQSTYLWQPRIMQPFINLSYLLLAMSYLKRSYLLLLVGAFVFISGVALHPAALGVLPMFLLVIILALKKQQATTARYIFFTFASLMSFLIFYLPNIIYIRTHSDSFSSNPHLFSALKDLFPFKSPSDFFQTFFDNTLMLLNKFFFLFNQPLFFPGFMALFIIALSIPLYFFYFQKDKTKKIYFLIIFGFIIQMLFLISIMKSIGEPLAFYYLTPVLGLFIILISEIIHNIFSKNIIMKSMKVLFVVLVVTVFLSKYPNQYIFTTVKSTSQIILSNTRSLTATIFPNTYQNVEIKPILFFKQRQDLQDVADIIKKEVLEIQKREGLEDINFFQIELYRFQIKRSTYYQYRHNSTLWALLEKDLNKKFVVVSDASDGYLKYKPTNDNKYVFVVCYKYRLNHRGCTEEFLLQRPNYILIKESYSVEPFSVYVMKKIND